jgi:hypothetical protein
MSRVNTNANANYSAEPVICIPRVFNNISEQRIRHVFGDLSLGTISRIDMVERKSENGETFKRVFIHFDRWFDNQNAQTARRKLIEGKEIKIVYDEPWFWKVSASKWTPQVPQVRPQQQQQQRAKAHIIMSDSPPRRRDEENVDEFGRCQLKRNNNSYTREQQYAAHRQFEERQRRPQYEDQRRPHYEDQRQHNIPIAPTLTAPHQQSQHRRHNPRYPEQQRYEERQRQQLPPRQQFIPRSPSSSPPRERPAPPAPPAPAPAPVVKAPVPVVEESDEEEQEQSHYQDPDDTKEEYNIVLNYEQVLNAPLPRKRKIVKNVKKIATA